MGSLPDLQSLDWKDQIETLKEAEKKIKPTLDKIEDLSKDFAEKSKKEAIKSKDKLGGLFKKTKKKANESKKKNKANANYALIEKEYKEGLVLLQDILAPSSTKTDYRKFNYSGVFSKTLFVYAYPRFLNVNWMAPLVNFDGTMRISQYIYPFQSAKILQVLTKKVTQMRSEMRIQREKGLISDPGLETAAQDAEQLRHDIQKGIEKFFQFGLYVTAYSTDETKLEKSISQLESVMQGQLVLSKTADVRMEQGFNATLPFALDELDVSYNMNTSPLSACFPFTSATLTSDEGILYGLNRHNDSLVIFDRFSLENANSVVFAKSGAGKSYAVKLEILRYLMLDTDVIVIDPENEYEALSQTVGGSYLRVSLNADKRINPFDLPSPIAAEILKPGDLLRSNIINLIGLMKLMLGNMTPKEEGIMDKALNDVYSLKGITMDLVDPSQKTPPTMEDLQSVLEGMDGADSLVQRLQKYTEGTYAGIFNKQSNLDLQNGLVVFSIRDLEDQLRPIAMYIILNYIWNRVRSKMKKRLLVVDEAWTMMQHEDSAKFLYGLVKRARKYYLGVTTITQDVEDFMRSDYGKPIITNSSMQLLLRQSPTAAELLQKTFHLTEGEKYLLLNSNVGQGLFFAGNKHVAIQIIASYSENSVVTTNPQEILNKQ
ncbi:conjugal transfer protein TraC [bacterium]|nr:conjugal transfer protein TraC [bacterium]